MLILRRWPGQDVIVTDILGNTLTIRVLEPRRGAHPRDVELGFTDRDRNFRIERTERRPAPSVEGHDIPGWVNASVLTYDPPPWTERGEGDAR